MLAGLAHFAHSQNSGTNDFSNFNSLFNNGGQTGVSDPNSMASGPSMLGNGQGFLGAQGTDLTQAGSTGFSSGMNPGMNNMNQGMNAGMNPGMNGGMNAGMNSGMNGGMSAGMNPGMNGGMSGQMNTMSGIPGQSNTMFNQGMGMSSNQQMMAGQSMNNPTGLSGQNGMMMNGQQGMAGGMQQNGFTGGLGQTQMNFQDPTRMGSLSNGNSFSSMAFDPRTQQNLFNDQLNAQNTPSFGGQSQMMQGQGQFGQSPFMQQQFGTQRPGQMGMGGRFASPFTSQPSGFGPFTDPMMNAFAPANPFMQRRPMMMPMNPFMMPGMRKLFYFPY